jgi:TonB family protein
VSIRSSRWSRTTLIAAVCLLAAALGFAQSYTSDDGKRKIKSRTTPAYPELARRMNVSGKVKLEVVIASDGHVRSIRPLGGHPLLVQACQDAVKDWKFLPGPEESTQIVECEFRGN